MGRHPAEEVQRCTELTSGTWRRLLGGSRLRRGCWASACTGHLLSDLASTVHDEVDEGVNGPGEAKEVDDNVREKAEVELGNEDWLLQEGSGPVSGGGSKGKRRVSQSAHLLKADVGCLPLDPEWQQCKHHASRER